ncbi:MAG TPA: phage antirepressor N-terminal domain-containing protein [Anaerolineae bacterium]|nr:phage antirepressor N-terminal domain-containing protein [Anaerolineae bacterium]
MSDQLIVINEQRIVLFLDDELIAVRAVDGDVYVSVGHLADALGLDRQGQTQRIERHTVLLSGYRRGEINTAGGVQNAYLLRVDLVPFWLAGVNTKRIKDDDRRLKIEQYQQNVAKVLWEAFQDGRLMADNRFDDLLAADSPAAQAYKMAAAIMQMAQQQLLLEAQMQDQAAKLQNHEQRLEQVEAVLGNTDRYITVEQASQISQAVKAIALVVSRQSGRNEYGGVYGELYRRFSITSYKQLPAHKFDQAMAWLTEWYTSVADDDVPF